VVKQGPREIFLARDIDPSNMRLPGSRCSTVRCSQSKPPATSRIG
jgi:hypothetical protein